MLVISYDIKDDKIRSKFSRLLMKSGGIRLQYSVYEFNNTSRLINNIKETINDDRSNPSIVEFTPTKETFMWMKNLYFFMESLSSHFEK